MPNHRTSVASAVRRGRNANEAAFGQSEAQAREAFARGRALRAGGNLEHAIGEFRFAVKLDPESLDAYQLLGLSLRDFGDLREAVRMFRTAATLAPDSASVRMNLGVALFELGKFFAASRTDEPLKMLNEAVELTPKPYAKALYNLGNVHYALGDHANAAHAYREALAAENPPPVAHRNLGNALARRGDLSGAIAAYRSAVRHGDSTVAAFHNLGAALLRGKEPAEAEAAFRAAVAERPTDGESWRGVGIALAMRGEYEPAREAFETALARRGGSFPEVTFDLGRLFVAMEQPEKAVAQFARAIQESPNGNGTAYFHLSRVYVMLRQYHEAVRALRELIAAGHDTARAHYELGIAQMQCEPPYIAEASFRTAIDKANDTYPEAWHRFGRVLMRQNKLEQAISAFRKAIEQANGELPEAHKDLGQALYRRSEFKAADEALNTAIRHERNTGRLMSPFRWELEDDFALRLRQAACVYDVGDDAEAPLESGEWSVKVEIEN